MLSTLSNKYPYAAILENVDSARACEREIDRLSVVASADRVARESRKDSAEIAAKLILAVTTNCTLQTSAAWPLDTYRVGTINRPPDTTRTTKSPLGAPPCGYDTHGNPTLP